MPARRLRARKRRTESYANHAADIRTCVLHPASETHRQLNDEQLAAARIDSGMLRLSVGLESVEDIISDLKQAFSSLQI